MNIVEKAQAGERKCSECGNGEPDLSLYCVRCLNNDHWHLIDPNQAGDGEVVGLRELAEDKAIACAYCGGAEIESVPVIVDDDMALSFHRALTDSSAGDSDIEDIKSGLRAALANAYTHPQPAQVNQQLLEALKGLRAVISETRGEPAREAVQIADAAIAAAQEGK